MKLPVLVLLFLPLVILAHPGIGIVKDSKGNIYFTDLEQVWKITDRERTVVVPRVHTHELYMDGKDQLWGQHERYDAATSTFHHYLWVLRPGGVLDTIVSGREAYLNIDFSLARDREGNEYYTKQFLKRKDSNHIYKKTPDGKETIFAKGNFNTIKWLHPQADGSILFNQQRNIYRADTNGNIHLVVKHIANNKPSFDFSGNTPTIWGLWEDAGRNVYAAVFSDQVVRKITTDGTVSTIHTSPEHWAPLHGVFDNEGHLWIMEASDQNAIRVVKAGTDAQAPTSNTWILLPFMSVMALSFGIYQYVQRRKSK
jgi:hypothetical protein